MLYSDAVCGLDCSLTRLTRLHTFLLFSNVTSHLPRFEPTPTGRYGAAIITPFFQLSSVSGRSGCGLWVMGIGHLGVAYGF